MKYKLGIFTKRQGRLIGHGWLIALAVKSPWRRNTHNVDGLATPRGVDGATPQTLEHVLALHSLATHSPGRQLAWRKWEGVWGGGGGRALTEIKQQFTKDGMALAIKINK